MKTREKKRCFFFSSLMILHSDVFFFVVVVGLFSVGFFVCLFFGVGRELLGVLFTDVMLQ